MVSRWEEPEVSLRGDLYSTAGMRSIASAIAMA
jgi:hypothetical protein